MDYNISNKRRSEPAQAGSLDAVVGQTCSACKHWSRLGEWWGRCGNEYRTAIETEDPGAGPEMTRKTFACSEWSPPNAALCEVADKARPN